MTDEMTALVGEVERETSLKASVVRLINTLADRIKASANDPAKIQALAAQLKSNNDELSDVVFANTEIDPEAGGDTGATGDTAAQG